ncbi:MAG: dUTP diphosphatase [Peptoniphilaceae bacterium]|uniref:dUTP diphosphatase n=1 Tax=Parvimonas sp. TaxID=1944660 RepID=UPI0025DBC4B3|nr:dUTP diphosphatase [Parvimonas sp.]MCI5997247.1 dUTP diphosphatase [Parvimonas sp.]MDD7764357.1 dUTP diphosphatase [Peptoniphilaceae bacterium]MDY3050057.1 dUTP diphosphatase [Parvimonas sp.]
MKLKIINRGKNNTPFYATEGASGFDLTANLDKDLIIKPFERVAVPTGLFMEIPVGYEGQIRARSGMSLKHGICMANGVGTIDSDYRGEIKVLLVNISNEEYTIKNNDRIAQMIISKYEKVNFELVEELSDTNRNLGGFGHTGY